MTRGQAKERRKTAWDTFLCAWSVALIPNLLGEIGVDLQGVWVVVRGTLSIVALVALLVLIAAFVREGLTPVEANSQG